MIVTHLSSFFLDRRDVLNMYALLWVDKTLHQYCLCYFQYDMHRVEPTPLPLPRTYNIGPATNHWLRVASRYLEVGRPKIRYHTLLQNYMRGGVGEAGVRNVRGMRKGSMMVKWCNVLSIHRYLLLLINIIIYLYYY